MSTPMLTTIEAARVMHVSPKTLSNWRYIGRGPRYIHISPRVVRYRSEDITEYLRAGEVSHV